MRISRVLDFFMVMSKRLPRAVAPKSATMKLVLIPGRLSKMLISLTSSAYLKKHAITVALGAAKKPETLFLAVAKASLIN